MEAAVQRYRYAVVSAKPARSGRVPKMNDSLRELLKASHELVCVAVSLFDALNPLLPHSAS